MDTEGIRIAVADKVRTVCDEYGTLLYNVVFTRQAIDEIETFLEGLMRSGLIGGYSVCRSADTMHVAWSWPDGSGCFSDYEIGKEVSGGRRRS